MGYLQIDRAAFLPSATQRIQVPSAAPRPNIRIAYIAGDASIAIHRGMATFPPAVRESTLEELAIAGLTNELIAAGRELLSPAMYAAFLRWGETASHLSTRYETDEDGASRCAAASDAGAKIASISAENIHDMLLKTRLLNEIEADCSDFGSIRRTHQLEPSTSKLALSISSDLEQMSPVTALIEQVATLAWDNSPAQYLALSPEIGTIITGAFGEAREALENNPPLPAALPAIIDGYSPFMRGPLIAWRKAYAVYEAATAALTAYDRDVHTPFFDRDDADSDKAEADRVQAGYDVLLDQQHDAIKALYRLPAPSAAELAIKLSVFQRHSSIDLSYSLTAIDQMTIDARRFGKHGAFLQADGNLLAAFAGCRHEMLSTYGVDAMSRDEEDAYFARLDSYEATLLNQPAATIEGVIAKLRVAFARMNADAWSDHAVMAPDSNDFREGLRMGGMFERMAWGAIEDLARIGGISLSEQGA